MHSESVLKRLSSQEALDLGIISIEDIVLAEFSKMVKRDGASLILSKIDDDTYWKLADEICNAL